MDANPGLIFILVAVLIAAIVGVLYLVFGRKAGAQLNVEKYQVKWLAIENSISRNNAASWQLAIMNADKLVDLALRERRFKGQTMGERMKSANAIWKNANHLWSAHKIRNQLAHEAEVRLNYEMTLRALTAFKQALKDLGAI